MIALLKEAIQRGFQLFGYEVHKRTALPPPPRATMGEGLRWLAARRFQVSTVLDVGASDGRWSAGCMEYFPGARYVLFEPQPVHQEALRRFASLPGSRVEVASKAVGGEVGRARFDASDPLGGVLVDDGRGATIEVPVTTVDAAVSELRLPPPFLLKLDTHGVEAAILDGARQTLRDCSALVIEAYAYRLLPETLLFWELCARLAEQGFRVADAVDTLHRPFDGSLWQMDLIFIRDDWPGFEHREYR